MPGRTRSVFGHELANLEEEDTGSERIMTRISQSGVNLESEDANGGQQVKEDVLHVDERSAAAQ